MAILADLTTREALTAVYIGYYDRAADPEGIAFWEQVVANTSLDLVAITSDFATQDETASVHPFFADPDNTSPNAFLTSVYQNLFNRDPDSEGLAFWANELTAAINGERAADDPNPDAPILTVGEIIIAIIDGAQGDDVVVINNKIEAALDWTATAESVSDFAFDSAAMASAKGVIDGVDDTAASVEAAKSGTADFFDPILNPPVEGETIDLEIGVTRVTGTTGDDQFNAFPGQNALGGVANTLSSASNLDGDAGYDRLHADLTDEFTGSNLSGDTDIQPRIRNIEEIDLEARDADFGTGGPTFDAKNVRDVEEIGSYFSDGDLTIENLTTLTSDGFARNTSAITIAMDHTGPENTNTNASDLTVYFDNDYLLNDAPVNSGAQLFIELMDLDAETLGQPPLLDNPFGLITFTFDGELKTLDYGTDSDTYAELLADIQEAIDLAAQTDSDFSQLTASFGPEFVVQDTDTDPNPAQPDLFGTTIVITNSGPEVLEAVTMQATGVQPAGKDFHTGFSDSPAETEEFPISVDIDLHKAGRGGEGGDLLVGGKALEVSEGIAGGIEVFNVSVLGQGADAATAADQKPSNIGTLTSTLGALKTVNIKTDEAFADGDSFASLEIREGFNGNDFFRPVFDSNGSLLFSEFVRAEESGDLQLVDANEFLGNLYLGTEERITNLDTLTALGGGDVVFNAWYNGRESASDPAGPNPGQDYTVLTAGGDDTIDILIEGDALDYAGAELEVKTGAGDDEITIDMDVGRAFDFFFNQNQQLNQAVLDNIDIDGEEGDDVIDVDGLGNANIHGGSGDDIIYTDGNGTSAVWAMNFDNDRVDAFTFNLPSIAADEIPGVQTSPAYLNGAVVTVTLSGAGVGDAADGGGVMSQGADGAVNGDDGYEARRTITTLNNGREFFGDQTDVNDAIIDAIENDDVLNALLSVSVGPNNTLLITSKTSGNFDPTDLKIEIRQEQAESSGYAGDVLEEAREVYGNSALTLTNLWGQTTFSSTNRADYEGPGALTTSEETNAWYDGLSRQGDDNELDDNLHTQGTASLLETDNEINGGADDDIIVLSTDSSVDAPDVLQYTPGGNNSLLDGTSNETVVMDGPNFGDDTVMNFTTTGAPGREVPVAQDIGVVTEYVQGGVESADPDQPGANASFILNLSDVPPTGAGYEIAFDGVVTTVDADATFDEIAALLGGSEGAPVIYDNWSAVDNEDGTVTFTANEPEFRSAVLPSSFNAPPVFEDSVQVTDFDPGEDPGIITTTEGFSIQFFDVADSYEELDDDMITILGVDFLITPGATAQEIVDDVVAGLFPGFTAADEGDGIVSFTSTTPEEDIEDVDTGLFDLVIAENLESGIPAGIDFLDFTFYLNSLQDESNNGTGSSDSDVSNAPIPVTLDFDLLDIQANEVAIVTLDDATNAEWNALGNSEVAGLINSSAEANDYGSLDASSANADDEYGQTATTDELVGGDAKAIVMIENALNLGEYKVFELSWNGDASNDDDSSNDGQVEAELIGSLDFGTSLEGIEEINLVGSDAHADLLSMGILNTV